MSGYIQQQVCFCDTTLSRFAMPVKEEQTASKLSPRLEQRSEQLWSYEKRDVPDC